MKYPQIFAILPTACLFLTPAVCPAAENAPTAPAAARTAGDANAESHRVKAEAGDALAQAMLADGLYNGIPSDAAFEEAAAWAEKSAAQGCPIGTALLGDMHKTGNGRLYDPEKGDQLSQSCGDLLLAGAKTNNPVWLRWAAQVRNHMGELAPPEGQPEPSFSMIRQAIEAGDSQAVVQVMRKLDSWAPQNDPERRRWILGQLRKAAENGSPPAMFELGVALGFGLAFPKDDAEAVQWHEKASALGWSQSRVELAKLATALPDATARQARLKDLQEQSVTPKNSMVAEEWFHELASGDILPKDETAANGWLARLDKERSARAIARVIQTLVRNDAGEQADRWFKRFEALNPGPAAYGMIRDVVYRTNSEPVKAIWYERAAKGGHPGAMTDLAGQFAEGYLRPKDESEARDWYGKAASSGNPHAVWMTARYLIKQEDFIEAREILTKAADKGNPSVCKDLAELMASGKGGPKDDAAATRYYRNAAELGDFIAALHLVYRLERKKGKALDTKEIERWKVAVERTIKSMPDSEKRLLFSQLARFFYRAGDKKESMRWQIASADAGDKSAADIVAKADPALLKDLKSPASIVDSVKKSAEEGDVEAMYTLAKAYEKGNGVKVDPIQSFRWYEAAARKGHYLAVEYLGIMCIDGQGVPKNPKKGVEWIRKAAEKGSTRNMLLLGSLYSSGKHVPMSGAEAAKWYEKAALGGNADAMADLGVLYTNGKGVPKEYVTGYMWANAATAKANDEGTRKYAEELRVFLEKRMTAPQIALAQQKTLALLARVEEERDRIVAESARGKTPGKEPKSSAPGFAPTATATGTAWAVTADGYLLTAAHVVRNSTSIHAVDAKGKSHFALVLKSDEANDLALLKIVSETKGIPLRHKVVMGQKVATIGFPNTTLQGTEAKVTEGIVNSLSGAGDDPRQLQISVPVQPGNSGGPLIDMSGAAVGLVSSRLRDDTTFDQSGALPQMVNYAQKISHSGSLLEDLRLPAPPAEDKSMDLPTLVGSIRESVYFLRCKVETK